MLNPLAVLRHPDDQGDDLPDDHVDDQHDDQHDERSDDQLDERSEPADGERVEVRRNLVLAAVLGAAAAVVAVAYLLRAIGSGSLLDWLITLAIGAVAVTQGLTVRDARTPLLVADRTGVRLRLGRTWQGLPWQELEEVEHAPRHGVVRDGRLVAFPVDPDAVLAELEPAARRQAALTERVHGAPFAVPLGLTTRVVGAEEGLTAALVRLAPDAELVVEVIVARPGDEDVDAACTGDADNAEDVETDAEEGRVGDTVERPRPEVAARVDDEADLADPTDLTDTAETDVAPLRASATPSPLRPSVSAVRAELSSRLSHRPEADAAPAELEDTGVWRSETVVVPEMAVPARTPVIGPRLTAARRDLGLDVAQLAQRTRIRPHVIEAIEVDDFEPCGGDFYARGHLRTLARVLGVDATPLLATYDETYADAPIDPRRVFEAELSTASDGPIRSLRGGANWSVVVACVMAVVLAWSVARLVIDRPADDAASDSPSLSTGSAGLTSGEIALAPKVPVVLTAEGGGAKVVVRDGAGAVVFKGNLAFGQSKTLKASPPVRVQTSDGSLTVGIDGEKPAAMGRTGKTARNTYVPTTD